MLTSQQPQQHLFLQSYISWLNQQLICQSESFEFVFVVVAVNGFIKYNKITVRKTGSALAFSRR